MKIRAVIHKAEEGGFWAEVPALPGCSTQGETEEEIRANLQEAIELWFEAGDDVSCHGQNDKIMELAVGAHGATGSNPQGTFLPTEKVDAEII